MPRPAEVLDALWTLVGFWVFLALCLLAALIGLNSLPAHTLAAPMTSASPLKEAAALEPAQTPMPAATPLSTPRDLASSLADPLPTLLTSPAFTAQGALDQAAAQRLYDVSLGYLAFTEQEANALARKLAFAGSASHASNMCGPLAVALLRDAGLIEVYVDLHDFWLLQMDKNIALVREVFPADKFDHYHFDTPIDKFDFRSFPLVPGDFLYLYAGPRGTFNHMLVVTRVDATGRAYTVTNLNGPNGYTVREAMLYDPSRPGDGLFYDYTNREKNRDYGLTGFGGFDVIRRKVPPVLLSPAEQAFTAQVNALIERAGGDWRVLVHEVGGRDMYSRHADRPAQALSIVNVPIAMLFFKSLEQAGIPPEDYRDYIVRYGNEGRTYSQLLQAMLLHSEKAATQSLLQIIEYNGIRASKVLSEWGLENTVLNSRRSTPREIARVYELLYTNAVLPPEANRIVLEYLAEQPAGDVSRLQALRDLLPENAQLFGKRGTITQDALIVGDSALVVWEQEGRQRAYILVLIAHDSPQAPTTYGQLESAFAEFAGLFWQYVSSEAP